MVGIRRGSACLASFALVLLSSLPVVAADEAGGHGGGNDGGLLNFVPATMLWSIGIFVVVLLILKRLAWAPILKALDERESKIRDSLEAADKMRAEQVKFQAEQEKVLAAARKEATEIVAEGKRDAEVVKDGIVQDARVQSEDLKRRAISEINRAKDLAVVEIHRRTVDLSVQIAEKLLQHSVNVDDQERLVQETIDQYQTQKN